MSENTAFITMENISYTCTRLGQKIEKHMFSNPYLVIKLSAHYVSVIEKMLDAYFKTNRDRTLEILTRSESQAAFLHKINWIKEVYKQTVAEDLTVSTFQMVQVYRFLLEITNWYITTYEQNRQKIPHQKELQLVTQDEAFKTYCPIWQQISETNTIDHQSTGGGNAEEVTLAYKDRAIYIPNKKASIHLQHLGIKGCNHFLKELAAKNMHTLKDLPQRLDDIDVQLTGVGPTTVQKMWSQLVDLFSNEKAFPLESRSQTNDRHIYFMGQYLELSPAFARLHIQEKDFPGLNKAIQSIKRSGIHTYDDLPRQLQDLTELPGIGEVGVQHFFNQMKILLTEKEKNQQLAQLTNDERLQYEYEKFTQWLEQTEQNEEQLRSQKIPFRYFRILRKRYHSCLKNEHLTLQQLGDAEGVTRERIRQIVRRGNIMLARMWSAYIQSVQDKLQSEGNYLLTEDYAPRSFADYVLKDIFEAKDIYVHETNGMYIVTHKDEELLIDCVQSIEQCFYKTFDLVMINKHSYTSYCEKEAKKHCVPVLFVQQLSSQWIRWMDEREGILKNISKAKIVEMVMLNYPNGASIYKNEPYLNKEANRLMPGSFESERAFTAVFAREDINDRLLLWARGVYIHKTFIKAEESWVRKIQHQAYTLLQAKKFMHVRKLFTIVYKEACAQQVPNEYALFSLMRVYNEDILSLERFPMIQVVGDEWVSNEQRIIEFIEKKGMFATKQDLIHAFVQKRGWKKFTVEQVLSDSLKIVPYEHGVYTLETR